VTSKITVHKPVDNLIHPWRNTKHDTMSSMQLSDPAKQSLLAMGVDLVRRNLSPQAGQTPSPPVIPNDPELMQPAGCFVSLHDKQTHALRGCIGILESKLPLRETLAAAAEGVIKDPRFVLQPVTFDELPNLEIEITVIAPMQPAPSPLDFDLQQQGIFLTIAGRSGCFLPQVARETGWNRQQLLARLCTEKLGLPDTAWRRPDASLRTFTAQILGPHPMAASSAK
jgi:uncharacterized protein